MAARRPRRGLRRWLRRVALALLAVTLGYYGTCAALLVLLRYVNPPITTVQIQRRIEGGLSADAPGRRRASVPLERISDHLEHAVIAAEDSRFLEHRGVDWEAISEAADDNRRRGRAWRGGSTITQQLVKNLFMTTHSSWLRKAAELPLAYMAELALSKRRILELYLNEIEWGDGVYGAEAAARAHYGIGAAELSREQAAGLAACIPNPRVRKPQRMADYREIILARMSALGW